MEIIELNPDGNFETWENSKLEEIAKKQFSNSIGNYLFENDKFRMWEIILKPKQRLPFRVHSNNCNCTAFTDAILVSRRISGRISLVRLNKGDSVYKQSYEEKLIYDLENIGENTVKITVVEEKLQAEAHSLNT